jgi:phytoene/squalene synthetase
LEDEEEVDKMKNSAALAHSITWHGSKQSYLMVLLLVDRGLVNDCLRAYAYFRWADDMVDISFQSSAERLAFIARQKTLVDQLYRGERPDGLCLQEDMLVDLIAHDSRTDNGLRSFIYNFMAVIEFDANRMERLVTRQELDAYTSTLALAVMDGIQHFIENGHPYPKTPDRTLAVSGAHLVHMLRDMLNDLPAGYINIPVEELDEFGIRLEDTNSESFNHWVHQQTQKAGDRLQAGKNYIEGLDHLRCKLAGIWYYARFEWYLYAIQRDDCHLRLAYPECQNLSAWLKMAWLGLVVTFRHIATQMKRRRYSQRLPVILDVEGHSPSCQVK